MEHIRFVRNVLNDERQMDGFRGKREGFYAFAAASRE